MAAMTTRCEADTPRRGRAAIWTVGAAGAFAAATFSGCAGSDSQGEFRLFPRFGLVSSKPPEPEGERLVREGRELIARLIDNPEEMQNLTEEERRTLATLIAASENRRARRDRR